RVEAAVRVGARRDRHEEEHDEKQRAGSLTHPAHDASEQVATGPGRVKYSALHVFGATCAHRTGSADTLRARLRLEQRAEPWPVACKASRACSERRPPRGASPGWSRNGPTRRSGSSPPAAGSCSSTPAAASRSSPCSLRTW